MLVAPQHRGKGLGRDLVGCVLDMARQRGFAKCRLEVIKSNSIAYGLYVLLGFRIIEDRGEKLFLEVDL